MFFFCVSSTSINVSWLPDLADILYLYYALFAIYCAENHVLHTLCGRLHRQKKTDQGNSWWSQLIIDLPDETPTASGCPLNFHIVSECFMFFFSEWFTMFHHVASFLTCVHHVFTIAPRFPMFQVVLHWEMVVKTLGNGCFTNVSPMYIIFPWSYRIIVDHV